MIRVAINAFENAAGLERTLKSIRTALPSAHITVVDGAYAQFPVDHAESLDGSLDIASCLADEVIRCSRDQLPESDVRIKWQDEVVKRTAYLNGASGDVYLVI